MSNYPCYDHKNFTTLFIPSVIKHGRLNERDLVPIKNSADVFLFSVTRLGDIFANIPKLSIQKMSINFIPFCQNLFLKINYFTNPRARKIFNCLVTLLSQLS
jgi:hypothetical protein